MKHSRQAARGLLLRIFAAGALFVWLAALTLCSVECDLGHSHSDLDYDQRAASSPHDEQSPDSGHRDSHDDSFCISLKTSVHTPNSIALTRPDFGFALALSPISPPRLLAIAEIESRVSRRPPDREWVFTPEVSLGPAFRSHAPPLAV